MHNRATVDCFSVKLNICCRRKFVFIINNGYASCSHCTRKLAARYRKRITGYLVGICTVLHGCCVVDGRIFLCKVNNYHTGSAALYIKLRTTGSHCFALAFKSIAELVNLSYRFILPKPVTGAPDQFVIGNALGVMLRPAKIKRRRAFSCADNAPAQQQLFICQVFGRTVCKIVV